MKLLKILLIFYFLISCDTTSYNNQCDNCNGGKINDYLFKKVTLEDLTTNLLEIAPSISIDQCIRYKINDNLFEDAIIVDDCCCTVFR
ncbi:MAG: hypothetical protein ACJZ12_03960 [Candidatus Neomarinimicrobiota bacterium]